MDNNILDANIADNVSSKQRYFDYLGTGGELFVLFIVNMLLCAVTLGFYYPWANVKFNKYAHQKTTFDGKPFDFTGTGLELFIGFLKAIGVIIVLVAITTGIMFTGLHFLAIIFLYGAMFVLMPIAIHGSLRYQASRTTWDGVQGYYSGNLTEFIKLYIKGILLTIITLGIYSFWFAIELRKYIFGHLHLGNVDFSSKGDGTEYFWMNVKGILLSIVTLGIYLFWFSKDLFNYLIGNIEMHQGNKKCRFHGTMQGMDYFVLSITNILIIVFTLGFGFAWALVRTAKFITKNVYVEGDIEPASIGQNIPNRNDAAADALGDLLGV